MSSPSDFLTVIEPSTGRRTAQVEIVIPVYDEEAILERSIRRLHRYLDERFPLSWCITIADNASTDGTWVIATALAAELPGVQAVHLPEKGRGRALRATWTASPSPVLAYMDVDLSTDLDALLPLVAPLLSGHSDVAIGTRLAPGSRVVRGPKREAISRSYNLLLRATLRSGFSDAQCGFKAIRREVARALLPVVEDEGWFFDTELLVLAEHNGLRIHEVPVDWVDDPDSRVDVAGTARADLQGIWRMAGAIVTGRAFLVGRPGDEPRPPSPVPARATQLVRFASIGLVSTAVFALLFVLLVGPVGPAVAAVAALAMCTVANTAANRRLTFALRGRTGRARHYRAGLALAGLPLALILVTLAGLAELGVTSTSVALLALTAANIVASLGRFVLLRRWVFRPAEGGPPLPPAGATHAAPAAPGRPTAGSRVRRSMAGRWRQFVRYGAVSAIATATSLTVLGTLVATDTLPAGWANVVATAVGTIPSFELNRRWVWRRHGERSLPREVVPFVALSFAGLGLSTLFVSVAARWAASAGFSAEGRTVAVELASVAAFGSLWLAQFVILDRVLFAGRRPLRVGVTTAGT